MSRFYDYDPHTGIHETYDFDDDGSVTIHQQEDVEGLLEQCKMRANQSLMDGGIKAGFWHYADIPATVILELKKKGIDIYNPDHSQRLFAEINQNYPYLKTTRKIHA